MIRAYTVGIGVVCAGAVVLTLQAQHDADAAQKRARLAQQEAANWESTSIRALNERNRLARQVNSDVARYNTLVDQANKDKKKYVDAINQARAGNHAATQYVSSGTIYRSTGGGTVATSAASSSGSTGTSSSSSTPSSSTS
jgi:hypothetical protein